MDKVTREWNGVDKAISKFFKGLKQDSGSTVRALAENIGVSQARIMYLLQGQRGTPTMQEFIAICEYFGKDPIASLQQIFEDSKEIDIKEQERKRQELLAEIDSLHDTLADKLRMLGDLEPVANEHPYLDQDTDFDD